MNEILYMVLALIAGFVLGIIFFGGLWYTVRKMAASPKPALWILGSFLFRTGITLIGFYFIALGNWKRLIICLFGFVAARFIVLYFTKVIEEKQAELKKEVGHET